MLATATLLSAEVIMINNIIQQTTSHNQHINIICDYYYDIQAAFHEAGSIAPDITDLYNSGNWRYCQPIKSKNKYKIGYICSHSTHHNQSYVKITIHSFANSGSTVIFDSRKYIEKIKPSFTIKPPMASAIATKKAKEEADIKRRTRLFNEHKQAWQVGNPNVANHPYIVAKNITETRLLRTHQQQLLLPIQNIDNELCAIQTIAPTGQKRFYGKKKGGFIVLGYINQATRLYLCEGYATANAVFHLVKQSQKRHVPFAVISALDNHNLEYVTSLLTARFKNKKITICPDNDVKKVSNHAGNAGLLSGLNCALKHGCEIKILPEHLLKITDSDWCDLYSTDKNIALNTFIKKDDFKRFDLAVKRLRCFHHNNNSISLKKFCIATLKIALQVYPDKLHESAILETILTATSNTGIPEKMIRHWWSNMKKRRLAQSIRCRSIVQQQPEYIQKNNVNSLEDLHTQMQSLKQKYPKAIFITNAPMGAGKTKHFIQPEFICAESRGEIPIIITPTKALTKGVSERFGCSHYIDDAITLKKNSETQEIPSALAITINSIIAPQFQEMFTFSTSIFIDEYTQVLRSITTGTVNNHQRQTTEKRLATLIKNSHYTYIADADFNQIALNQIQSIVGKGVPIFIFTLDNEKKLATSSSDDDQSTLTAHSSNPIEYRFYREKDNNLPHKYLIKKIEEAAKKGQKLYVASDSKRQLDLLSTALTKSAIDLLVIDSDTVNFAKQKAFLDAPDQFLIEQKPQVVLVSPAIQSGVSIEIDYFDRCFGI